MQRLRLAAFCLLIGRFAIAAVPAQIDQQGRILKSDGTPETGSLSATFAIYDSASGGSTLWTEAHSLPLDSGGYYSVSLGAVTPFPTTLFDGRTLYLGIKLSNEQEMTPREPILSAPYAMVAGQAHEVIGDIHPASITVNGKTIVDTQGRVVLDAGCTTGQILEWDGSNWACTSPSASSGGTVTSVTAGAGLAGGTFTSAGTLSIAAGGVTNTMLQNSGVTVTPGAGLTGGGAVSLGGSTKISLRTDCSGGQLLAWSGTDWACTSPVASSGGTVTGVTAGAGLAGGTINSSGTLSIAAGGVTNTMLQNSGITITAGSGLTGGGTVALGGNVTLSAATTSVSPLRKYYVVLALQDASACPTDAGWHSETLANLAGANGYTNIMVSGSGIYIGASNNVGYSAKNFWVQIQNGLGSKVLCWKDFNTRGHPYTSVLSYGNAASCPTGYSTFPNTQLQRTDGYGHMVSNGDGIFFGGVTSWDGTYPAYSQTYRDGYQWYYWGPAGGGPNYLAPGSNTCLRVMGVEDDAATNLGVYPVVLGVRGPANCPAGYTYQDAHQLSVNSQANAYSYVNMNDNHSLFGGVYSWGFGGENYLLNYFTTAQSINYCFKYFPITAKPIASILALNGQNCPSDYATLKLSDANGTSGNLYVQRTAYGLYLGGVDGANGSWQGQDYLDGYITNYLSSSTADRVCFKLDNVTGFSP